MALWLRTCAALPVHLSLAPSSRTPVIPDPRDPITSSVTHWYAHTGCKSTYIYIIKINLKMYHEIGSFGKFIKLGQFGEKLFDNNLLLEISC